MERYYKIIDGTRYIKRVNEIVIKKEGKVIINPTVTMIIADGWEEYVYVEPEKTIEEYRQDKLDEIANYDSSAEVNEFYIHGMPVWLDKNTRVGLRLRFESEIALGREETTLWYEGNSFPLRLDDAVNMLHAIEIYASACYDNTQRHIAEVNKLESIDDIQSYEYTIGYPEKLHF